MAQIVARIPDDLIEELDRLVEAGVFSSRSEAIRDGLGWLLDRHRRAAIGREIVEGYLKVPQTDDDEEWSNTRTVAMIKEEPW